MTDEEWHIDSLRFDVISREEAVRCAAAEVTNASTDPNKEGSVNDLRMGGTGRRELCRTCRNPATECNGQYGIMISPIWLYLLSQVKPLERLLRSVCFFCSRERRPVPDLGDNEPPDECEKRAYDICGDAKTCHACNAPQPKYKLIRREIRFQVTWPAEAQFASEDEKAYATRPFTANDAWEIMNGVSPETCALFGLRGEHPREWVVDYIIVPGPCTRPAIVIGDGGRARGQDEWTVKLAYIRKIMTNVTDLQQELGVSKDEPARKMGKSLQARKYAKLCLELQYEVASFLNADIGGPKRVETRGAKKTRVGIQNSLVGKKGHCRGNLIGKRGNYSARTVIIADQHIGVHEVGIPYEMSREMLQPVPAFPLNFAQIKADLRKPDCGGLVQYRSVKGDVINLEGAPDDVLQRIEPRIGDVFKRRLRDGDVVLANRQPSLHKPSMMAHVVRILLGRAMRLNLAATTPYNADCDGDEMNNYIVQCLKALAEIKVLMGVHQNIILAKNSAPIIALKHSAIVVAYLMSAKSAFFTRAETMDFIMQIERGPEQPTEFRDDAPDFLWRLPIPAILKPVPLWTGKQILSLTIPRGVTFEKGTGADRVVIRDGEILTGRLCKQTLGAVPGGIVDVIASDISRDAAGEFISAIQRVLYQRMLTEGFSEGLSDCKPSEHVAEATRTMIADAITRCEALSLTCRRLGFPESKIEGAISQILGSLLDRTSRLAMNEFHASSSRNAICTMIACGSKGNVINLAQLGSLVGQQSINGRRIKSHKRLFSDQSMDSIDPRDFGFIENSFFTGLVPTEFMQQAIAGREGLVDTAVKTAEIGYLQRRLVKGMETHAVHYDGSVRNASGCMISYAYGNDGYDATMLQRVDLELLGMKSAHEVLEYTACGDASVSEAQFRILGSIREQCLRNRITVAQPTVSTTVFVPTCIQRVIEGVKIKRAEVGAPERSPPVHAHTAHQMVLDAERVLMGPGSTCGNVSGVRLFHRACLWSYLCAAQVERHSLSREELFEVLNIVLRRHAKALVEPAEMVGSLAACSIGEPATQMTLNTFHFAGVMTKNVTQGIPRLIELADARTTLSSPCVTVYYNPGVTPPIPGSLINTVLSAISTEIAVRPLSVCFETDSEMMALYAQYQRPKDGDVIRIALDVRKTKLAGLDVRAIARLLRKKGFTVNFSEPNAPNWVIHVRSGDGGLLADQIRPIRMMRVTGVDGCTSAMQRTVYSDVLHPDGSLARTSEQVTDVFGVVQLNEIWMMPGVNWRATVSNSLQQARTFFGNEGPVHVLFHEMRTVLGGSDVLDRHQLEVINAMTSRGALTQYNRHGINRNAQNGILFKACFEETVDIFNQAARFGLTDPLIGVTENIAVGNTAPIGTESGLFEVLDTPEYSSTCAKIREQERAKSLNIVRTRFSTVDQVTATAFRKETGADPVYNTGAWAYGDSQYALGDGTSPDAVPWCVTPEPEPENDTYEPVHEPTYEPRSPTYEPVHEPTYEPVHEPTYEPKSPTYAPHSPAYEPRSPTYRPMTPPNAPEFRLDVWQAVEPELVPAFRPTSPSDSMSFYKY